MMTEVVLEQARTFAAALLEGMRRQDLALIVRAGEGDDFPEVISAAALLEGLAANNALHEEALRLYADSDFWDDDLPGGSLASHDKGQMARNVLVGRSPFHLCE
jgi:hypothetical protein